MEAAGKGLVVEEEDAVRLFVGLPADVVVSDSRGVCRPRAILVALRVLKLLGVDGVELPVSWAAVQPGPGGWFEWAGYLAVASMVGPASRSPPTAMRSLSGWPTPRPPTPTSSSPTGPGTSARGASPSPSTSSRCSSASRRSRPTRPSSAALPTSSTTSWSQPLRM
ncbi:hypothetical protein SEVIR_7G078800v4 [Setaria viridis]|uniref:Beta-amylase n=1 Tax=Setaria viridis TaxID=4556 RepID=A0A4U6TN11_SETVI|nr:hypothetical protein SEVIR_7G078800v2 [Setaria viridis]